MTLLSSHTLSSAASLEASDMGEVSSKGFEFGLAGSDAIVMPIDPPRLKWLNMAQTDQGPVCGWHLEYGVDPSLDEILDRLGMRFSVVEQQGQDVHVYWKVDPCSLIVIAEGVLSVAQMRSSAKRTGIAYGRMPVYDDHGQPRRYTTGAGNIIHRRVMKLRCFLHELVREGYHHWFSVTVSNLTADSLQVALSQQFRVIEAFRELTHGKGAPFYGFSLPTAPGERITFPRRDTTTEEPISVVPIVAQIPEHITTAYLSQHVTPLPLVEQIREHLLAETIVWSEEESRRISFPIDVSSQQAAS